MLESSTSLQHTMVLTTLLYYHTQAPKPSPGPHKQRECLPLIIILRNRLKYVEFGGCWVASCDDHHAHKCLCAAHRYALTGKEVQSILMQRHVKVDGKVRVFCCSGVGGGCFIQQPNAFQIHNSSLQYPKITHTLSQVRTDTTYPAGFMDVIELDATNEYFRLVFDTKGRFVVHRISKEESSYKLLKVKQQATGKGGVPHIVTHDGRTIRYPDPDIKVGVEWVLLSGAWQ